MKGSVVPLNSQKRGICLLLCGCVGRGRRLFLCQKPHSSFLLFLKKNETLMLDFTATSPNYKISVPDYLIGITMYTILFLILSNFNNIASA